MDDVADVLVVGAGPVGLLLTGELAAAGVSVRIIDRRRERAPWSKAMTLHPRSLEVLDLAADDLADRVVRHGYSASGLTITAGTASPVHIRMHALDTRFPFLLMLHQAETERMLEDWLGSHNVSVEYGWRFVDLDDDGDRVVATLHDDRATTRRITVRWLVGCDGGDSTVRERAGMSFTRSPNAPVGMTADVKVDGGPAELRGRIMQWSTRQGLVHTLPFRDGWIRMHVIDRAGQQGSADEPLTLAELQAAVDAMLPFRVSLSDPRWLTRFSSTVAQVDDYRAGRVLLAGDAAHLLSPAEGGSMNLGLQDAHNLAWKLALVVGGQADDRLLDTYTNERRPVGAAMARRAEAELRAALHRNPITQAARELATRTLMRMPSWQRTMRERASGIGVQYRHARWATHPRGAFVPTSPKRPGDRVADVELVHADGRPTRLYALLRGTGLVAVVTVALDHLVDSRAELDDLLRTIDGRLGTTVRPIMVLDEGIPEVLSVSAPVLVDRGGRYAAGVSAEHGDVVLLRPDAHIAARSAFFHAGPLLDAASAHGLLFAADAELPA